MKLANKRQMKLANIYLLPRLKVSGIEYYKRQCILDKRITYDEQMYC
jgi:hypothetical protein